MTKNRRLTVGVDGITAFVSFCGITQELRFPDNQEQEPYISAKPKGTGAEIGIILPRTIRNNNLIGFGKKDIKSLDETITNINRTLKKIIGKEISDLFVNKVEVALTINLGKVDNVTTNSLLQLFKKVLLVEKKENKKSNKKNTFITHPQCQYAVGKKRKNCSFILDEEPLSIETSLWSNRRLKWKIYSKGAGSVFGGDNSIIRLEGVYVERGIKHILGTKEPDITLQEVLTTKSIEGLIEQFKIDYCEIVSERLKGYMKETEQLLLESLETNSAYNAIVLNRDILPDINIFRQALKRYYMKHGKTEVAFRKMFSNVTRRLNRKEIFFSSETLNILEEVKKIMNT